MTQLPFTRHPPACSCRGDGRLCAARRGRGCGGQVTASTSGPSAPRGLLDVFQCGSQLCRSSRRLFYAGYIVLLEWIPLFRGHSRPAFSLTRRNNRAYEGEQSAEDAGGRGDVGGGEEIGVVEWTCQRIDRSARGGPRHRSRGASPARPTPARATPHDTMSNPLLDSRCPDSRSLPHVVLAPCIFIARALDSLDSGSVVHGLLARGMPWLQT